MATVSTDKTDYRARITDEMVQEMRDRIGEEIKGRKPYIYDATEDTMRNWAKGLGDYNPLWHDPEYAAKTRWESPICHPAMFYAFNNLSSATAGGMKGVHGFYAGTSWKWLQPVRLGDRITAKAILKDFVERPSTMAGRSFQQIGETTLRNQRGEVVAIANPYSFRMERDASQKSGKHKSITLKKWSADEIRDISRQHREQENLRRGAEPRYFEDVKVGDSLGPIIRGPITVSDIIVFLMGWGGAFIKAHGEAYDWYDRHPAGGPPNEFGIPESSERVHWDSDYARSVGVPAAYDYGPQRIGWLASLVTDWMGDDGFLESMDCQVRGFVMVSDLITLKGKVIEKEMVEGKPKVKVEIFADNHRDQHTALGTATVVLPAKNSLH